MKLSTIAIAIIALSSASTFAANIKAKDVSTSNGGNLQIGLDQLNGEVSGLSSDVFKLYGSTQDNATAIKALQSRPVPKDGAKGEKGDTGANGIDGKDGKDGANGIDGKDGANGIDGKDGEKGDTGAAGKDGKDGANGIDGKDGEKGDTGAAGKDGANGDTGAAGKDGANGVDGSNGIDGKDGKDGANGKDADESKVTANKFAIESEAKEREAQNITLTNGVTQAQETGDYAQSRIDAANANIEANKSASKATNERVAQNTADIANHEQRLGALESGTNSKFAALKSEVDNNRKRASAGIAGVSAMANIPQVLESQKFSVGAGIGNTDGESALAVGFSARASQNVVIKASVSNDTQHNFVVGAGLAYGW